MRLGERIRKLREAEGWTLSQLAEKAAVSVSHLSQLERYKESNIGAAVLLGLARAFGMSMESLLLGKTPAGDRPGRNWRIQAGDGDHHIALEASGPEQIFDELVIDRWFHLEAMSDRDWWLDISGVRLDIHVAGGKAVVQVNGEVVQPDE